MPSPARRPPEVYEPGWITSRLVPSDLILASMVINRGWIEPDELANLYVFLATPAAKDITGQAYNYDRGQVMA